MKHTLLLALILLLPIGGFSARETKRTPRTIRIQGHDHVSLKEWAERTQLNVQWLNKDEELRLTNKNVSLWFKLNSQRAEINGISVFLSFPLQAHNGEPFIALRDVDHLLTPILRPGKSRSGARVKTIALCPGHGGTDPGFQIGGEQEKKHTLLLARELQKVLLAAGFKVLLLREADRFVGLEERPLIAKRGRADLYLCLHYNSAGASGSEAHGVEVYCLTLAGSQSTNGGSPGNGAREPGNRNDDKNVLLAYQMQKSLVRNLGMTDRGMRRARFVVLRLAEMPAAYIEAGFMSNPEELKRIKDPAHRRRTAQAILEGLMAYKRLVEP